MNLLIIFIGIIILKRFSTVEYGYLFNQDNSFIQTRYSILCNESAVKFELLFDETVGVVFVANNKIHNSSLLVYFRRPGIYLNATFGKMIFHIPFMLDFFSNEWFAWHEIEIKVTPTRLGLIFDGRLREGFFPNQFMFPSNDVEENIIYFGLRHDHATRSVPAFKGMMRNFQFHSCGCTEWQPVSIVATRGVSLDNLGNCSVMSSCNKGCSCLLFPWGGRKCDCAGLLCSRAADDIFYGFDDKDQQWYFDKRIKVVSSSEEIHYGVELFDKSFQTNVDQWMILSTTGKSCFRNVFFCDRNIYYQFWLKLLPNENPGNEARILKHSSSNDSVYGLEISRQINNLRVVFSNDDNNKYELSTTLLLSIWNRITISFNGSHLNLFVNSILTKSTNNYIIVSNNNNNNNNNPSILNTKYLYIGEERNKAYIEIDNFHFSTNPNILSHPSIQILRHEQHSSNKFNQHNKNCISKSKENIINATICFQEQFQKSNFSLGFYMSLIFTITVEQYPSLLIDNSIFGIHLIEKDKIKINIKKQSIRIIQLRKSLNKLFYLEISFSMSNKMMIYQDIDLLLDSIPYDKDELVKDLRFFYLLVNGNPNMLQEIIAMNIDKDMGQRAFVIPSTITNSYSLDFESLDGDIFSKVYLSEGYLGMGLVLQYPNSYISFNNFDKSCIRNGRICIHGSMISFWFKFGNTSSISEDLLLKLFSIGHNNMALWIDSSSDFILMNNNISWTKFINDKQLFSDNRWNFLELSVSPGEMISLYINNIELLSVDTPSNNINFQCNHVCFGDDSRHELPFVLFIDEITIWDSRRDFLYANRYSSRELSNHKLYSFSNYQLDKHIKLGGSAKLISTKYGQGVSLNGFGPRYVLSNLSDDNIECFLNIDACRRGIMVQLLLRIDNLAIPQQKFVSSSQLTIGSNLGCLFVHLTSKTKSWYFISKDILQIVNWHMVLISWRLDNGMKVFLNNKLIGHIFMGTDNPFQLAKLQPLLYFGCDYKQRSKDYSTSVIDDFELFEADRSNLGQENRDINDHSCIVRHNFDSKNDGITQVRLGIIGNAGIFVGNSTSDMIISAPECFNRPTTSCNNCFTLRFWVYLNKLNNSILQMRNLRIHVSLNSIDVVEGAINQFVCFYNNKDLLQHWNLFELSWDIDEGVLVFINRELLSCKPNDLVDNRLQFLSDIKILKSFDGAIDELELYKSRICLLYFNKLVDEMQVNLLIDNLKDKKQLQKDMAVLMKNRHHGNVNVTVQVIKSFEFNGSNYLEYRTPINNENNIIPGSKEEIEVSFKILSRLANSIIWISESKQSKSILSIKKDKLYFTNVYFISSLNGTKRISEELEIYQNIQANVVYNLVIYQKSGQFVMKITSQYESAMQSMIGRENLLPINSNIFFGGYRKNKNSENNETNSSFVGVIYKAKVKSMFNSEPVDIIQEMATVKSNPNIVNHGNVKAIVKSTETIIPPKASFLGTIIEEKMSLMIKSQFISISLPKWDFQLLVSLELEFSTYESRGLLVFIGNSSHFLSVEIFDSQLYFVYKLGIIWKRVKLNENAIINDNQPHDIYLGRDLSGSIKVFFDKRDIIGNVQIPNEFINSSTTIGYFSSKELWPMEIMSRNGFMGCIHYIGINDVGFLNFTRWKPFIVFPNERSRLFYQWEETFQIGSCFQTRNTECSTSPCQGGLCNPTYISVTGQFSRNFKCNCLYASKSMKNNFTEFWESDNFNKWIKSYMLESRSQSCTEDSPQILIIENSYFRIDFKLLFPFHLIIDIEFLLLMKSSNGCIVNFGDGQNNMEVLVVDKLMSVTLSGNLHFTIPNVFISDGQWHGIQLNIRFGFIRLKIDNIEKVEDSIIFPDLYINRIILGRCSKFRESHFQLKHFLYNNLNILQNFHDTSSGNLFYKSRYVYPYQRKAIEETIDQFPDTVVTFHNNFDYALPKVSSQISWLYRVELELLVQYPGQFFHLINGDKMISIVICNQTNATIVYKDGYRNITTSPFYFDKIIKIVMTVDLIKSIILCENLDRTIQHQIAGNIYSWNVGDYIQMQLGVNKDIEKVLSMEKNTLQHQCWNIANNKSFLGCLNKFTVTNNKNIHRIHQNWPRFMKEFPETSISLGPCKDVRRCTDESCNNGVCKSLNFFDTTCDCSLTDFFGNKCQLRKPRCNSKSCNNNGLCILVMENNLSLTIFCNCNNTGFRGPSCEYPICRNDSCMNNGMCYVIGHNAHCNCSSTNYHGDKCEKPLCNSINSGKNCQSFISSKCSPKCINGGICASIKPTIKLCMNITCISENRSKCNCDHTLFRGHFCEQAEFGFNPAKDGVVLMDQLETKTDSHYFRILFEPYENLNKTYLLNLLLEPNLNSFSIYIVNNHVWLNYQFKSDQKNIRTNIGKVKKTNNLLVTLKGSEINYSFNSMTGTIPKIKDQPVTVRIIKRSIQNYPKLILGSDSDYNYLFLGLIAGFSYNGRSIMDERNKVIRGNKVFPINTLHTVTFPYQKPFLIQIPRVQTIGTILIIFATLVSLINIIFHIIKKRKRRTIRQEKGSSIEMDPILQPNQPIENHLNESDHGSSISSIKSNNIVQILVPTTSSIPNKKIHQRTTKIVLINNFMDLHKLIVLDYLIVPQCSTITILLGNDPQISIVENVFPLDDKDEEYRCISLHISSDNQYAYGHMINNDYEEDDICELQVWIIGDNWTPVCRPPNVPFTYALPMSGLCPRLLLMNQHISTISIWSLDTSVILWTTALINCNILPFHSIAISDDAQNAFINYKYLFQFINFDDDSNNCQRQYLHFPFASSCQQILPMNNNKFLLRTECHKVFVYDGNLQSFKTELVDVLKVNLIATNINKVKSQFALATSNGEIYLSDDIEKSNHIILGPSNNSKIMCIAFSSDGNFLVAGYENNLIHMWKISVDICLCHFYAIHELRLLQQLHFINEDNYLIAKLLINGSRDQKIENLLLIIDLK